MCRLLACLLIVSAVGCKSIKGHGDAVSGHGSSSHSHDGHSCALCDKKEKDRAVDRALPEREREAVVTQDIMLIPRMVYVPYAPQVPVAPARLGTMMPAGRPLDVPRDLPTPEPRDLEKPAPPDRVIETLDRCAQMMQMLDKRLCDLETRVQTPPVTTVPPVIIQQAPDPGCRIPLFKKPLLPCLGAACDNP